MTTFSRTAAERLQTVYEADHSEEIGTAAWKALSTVEQRKYSHFKRTDCVTFALEVLGWALEQVEGKQGSSGLNRVVAKHDAKGTSIAEYLVESLGWKGVYVTPDMYHPTGNFDEHAAVYRKLSSKCLYYSIPISFVVMNYSPTSSDLISKADGFPRRGETPQTLTAYTKLGSVEFGFGLSSGGDHTWLFSSGYVYEVHYHAWGKDGGLYEKTALGLWSYVDNVVVVPPDGVSQLELPDSASAPSVDTCKPRHNPW